MYIVQISEYVKFSVCVVCAMCCKYIFIAKCGAYAVFELKPKTYFSYFTQFPFHFHASFKMTAVEDKFKMQSVCTDINRSLNECSLIHFNHTDWPSIAIFSFRSLGSDIVVSYPTILSIQLISTKKKSIRLLVQSRSLLKYLLT